MAIRAQKSFSKLLSLLIQLFYRSLICIKCNLCGLLCHGQKEEDLELHFNVFHEDVKFSTQHLDYLCRICMIAGQNDSLNELKDHLYNAHPDEVK